MTRVNLYINDALEHLPQSTELMPLQTFGVTDGDSKRNVRLNEDGNLELSDDNQVSVVTVGETIDVTDNTQIGVLSDERFVIHLKGKTHLWIGNVYGADVKIDDSSLRRGIVFDRESTTEDWHYTVMGDSVFVRAKKAATNQQGELFKGETINFGNTEIRLFGDELYVYGDWFETELPVGQVSRHDRPTGFPEYRRSPRLILREPEGEETLSAAPSPKERDNEGLIGLILPPLATLGMTIGVGVLTGRGLMVLAMAGTSLLTTVFSVRKYYKDKKKRAQEEDIEIQGFLESINEKLHEIVAFNDEQRRNAWYHYPDFQTLYDMVSTVSPRLYEKTSQHFDFLTYRLGLGEVDTSVTFKYDAKPEQRKTALGQQVQKYYDDNHTLRNMPIVGTLNAGVVGYVGQRDLVIEQLQLMVAQIATFQSYHDVEFVMIFPEEEKEEWDWMRWMPHVKLSEVQTRGFIYNQRTRDQILGSVNSILKERKNDLSEASRSESPIFLPHLVILVTDEKLVMNHTIMEFLQEDPSELGVSLVFTADVQSSLRENVKTVIDIRDSKTGNLVMANGVVTDKSFNLDHFPAGFHREKFSRPLAAIDHQLNLKSSIPESLDFLQMYGVKTVDELNIAQRWSDGKPRKTLAVPIGWRAESDIVELNLHEKADGPHGLLAGTTGSGKTEVVKNLITSLAVNFKPTDVAFLPIDFKGGALANDLEPLPHTVGAITNLDAASAMRALASINAEMKRRQAIMGDAGVSNINDYHKLIESGEVTEPMPHLVMISDEFAELKNQMPEFLDELVSIARVGRSLGVHLILATQKPAGVVNDQIWANSKFKIALKVADAQDSKEILKTPDAAEITQTGRGYLQVGNGKRYELFQTAYSGATYKPEQEESTEQELLMYRINDLGQYELLTQVDNDEVESVGLAESQMEAIVKKINEIFDAEGMQRPEKVWLPPLAEVIYADDVEKPDFKTLWTNDDHQPHKVTPIGIMDLPSQQAQETLSIDFADDGHLAIFSSPAYGKTSTMQTIGLSLLRQNRPDEAQFEILDFGLSGLIAFKDAPHTNNYLTLDNTEEIKTWFEEIQEAIAARKQLLTDNKVATINDYRTKTGETISEVYVFVDAYENSSNERWRSDLEDVLVLIARQGSALGMHLIMSAGKSSFIRANILANMRRRIMFTINEQGEASSILGRTRLEPADRPGAGLVKYGDDIVQFQALYPVKTDEDSKVNMILMDEVEAMGDFWENEKPDGWTGKVEAKSNSIDSLLEDLGRNLNPGEMLLGRDGDDQNQIRTLQLLNSRVTVFMTQTPEESGAVFEQVSESLESGTALKINFAESARSLPIRNQLILPAISGNLSENFVGKVIVINNVSKLLELYEEVSATREFAELETHEIDDDGDLEIDKFFGEELGIQFIIIDTERNLTELRESQSTEKIREETNTFVYFGEHGDKQAFYQNVSKYQREAVIKNDEMEYGFVPALVKE